MFVVDGSVGDARYGAAMPHTGLQWAWPREQQQKHPQKVMIERELDRYLCQPYYRVVQIENCSNVWKNNSPENVALHLIFDDTLWPALIFFNDGYVSLKVNSFVFLSAIFSHSYCLHLQSVGMSDCSNGKNSWSTVQEACYDKSSW